jgi:predicted Rossmann fold flavoprotein
MKTDVIIIGSGAAGLMCAMQAGQRGRSVALLDHAKKLAEKIRISGGGRCNFTNINTGPENFISANPNFCRSALARYSPQDFIALLQKHNIGYHEKTLGQLFCDDESEAVIAMLRGECEAAGVKRFMSCEVSEINYSPEPEDGETMPHQHRFHVSTSRGEFNAASLVIATGGLSIPKTGATPYGYHVAEQFGIPITKLKPGLVPLTFAPDDWKPYAGLTGVSLDTVVSFGKQSFRENMLVTRKQTAQPVQRQGAQADRRAIARLAGHPVRHSRLRQGRGDLRRDRYARVVVQDHGMHRGARPVFHRRSGGRHRLARRLQLPVGLGFRLRGGAVCLVL